MSATASSTTQVAPKAAPAAPGVTLQRKCSCGNHTPGGGECEECKKKKKLQRKAGGGRDPNGVPSIVHEVLRSSGRPLDDPLRLDMESRFGENFSAVRVHTDGEAARSAQGVSALAYTVGSHIVFGPGGFNPRAEASRKLLAHELAHTVQQRTMGPALAGVLEIGEPGDAYERQADMAAERALHGGPAPALTPLSGPRLQRQDDPYANLTIEQLRRRIRTDPEALEALRLRFRSMPDSLLRRYAYTDPLAQSEYEARTIVAREAQGQGQFSRPGIQEELVQDIQQRRIRLEQESGIVRRAPSAAAPGGRTQGGTLGSARTDIPGLENHTFRGASPAAGGQVNPQSNFPPATDPAVLPQTHGHAEQALADEIESLLKSVPRDQLRGRKIWMLIEQEPCSTCAQGVADVAVEAGVLRKLSTAFPEVTFEIRSLGSSAITVLQNGVRPGAAGGVATAASGAEPPVPAAVQVGTEMRVVSTTTQPNGASVSEIEYIFGENLEHLNRGAPPGAQVPSRMLLRVTQNAEGSITAVEALSGESQALAEALVRQTLPQALAGAEAGAGEGVAAGLARLSTGLRIGGWAAFAIITGYQLATATPEQRPRVLVTAAGGLGGGVVASYLVCNVALDIETLGWGLLICGFFAGGIGGFAGSAASGEVYDEVTRTQLDRALQDLDRRPRNVRILFNVLYSSLDSRQHPIDDHFVRQFMSIVPSNLRDYELVILAGQLGATSGGGAAPAPVGTLSVGRTGMAPARRQRDTVCPNCHRTPAELQPPGLGNPAGFTELDQETIAAWIQSQSAASATTGTGASGSAQAHAGQTHAPRQNPPAFPAQRDTVCPNCHRESRRAGSGTPPAPGNLDYAALMAMPTRRSLHEATLERLRQAIRRLPERQRPSAADTFIGPAPAPVHPPTDQRRFPTSGELRTVCPNCHRRVREVQQGNFTGRLPALTEADRETIATWMQAQGSGSSPRQPAPGPAVHAASPTTSVPPGTVCPNCHRGSTTDRNRSVLEHSLGFGTGPSGQLTEADRRQLEEWLRSAAH